MQIFLKKIIKFLIDYDNILLIQFIFINFRAVSIA